MSNQRKMFYEKNKDNFLQQTIDRFINCKDLVRTYVELENRIKALEGKADNKILLGK